MTTSSFRPVLVLVAVEALAVAVLSSLLRTPAYRIDGDDLTTWLATTPPTTAAVGLALPVVGLLAAWLTAVTVLYVLALVARAPVAVRALTRVTPAGIRGIAERAVAASLVTVSLAAPAAAAGATALPPGLRVPTVTAEVERLPEIAPPRPAAPAPTGRTRAGVAPAPATVIVAPGDHLWGIAARTVARATGTAAASVPAGAVAGYWAEVVTVNRPHLRSGDPDLIHPGEEVRLPPHPGAGG